MSASSENQMEEAVINGWTVLLEIFTIAIPKQDIVVQTFTPVGVISFIGEKRQPFYLHISTFASVIWFFYRARLCPLEKYIYDGGYSANQGVGHWECILLQLPSCSEQIHKHFTTVFFYLLEWIKKEININLL